MPLESSIVGSAGAPMVCEIDSRWTMAYAAALGDAMPCYMDTVRGVIAHPMFPVCFEWPVQVAMRAQFEKSTSLTREEAMRGVHATHDTVLHRPIRPPERLTTQLTVAGVETGENAENFGRPLRPQDGVSACETAHFERRIRLPPQPRVMR